MGADFLERTAPSFKKCWDKGRLELIDRDLFTRLPTFRSRSFAAVINPAIRLTKGDRITVDKIGDVLVASCGEIELARSEDSPAALLDVINDNYGVMQGTVEEVHEAAGIAEITICPEE